MVIFCFFRIKDIKQFVLKNINYFLKQIIKYDLSYYVYSNHIFFFFTYIYILME